MSERTISPGMDHMNPLPRRKSLEIGSTSPTATRSGPIKRKWSPDHSDSSTATLLSQPETLRSSDNASPHDGDSLQGFKRAKVDESLSAKSPSAGTVRTMPVDRSHLPGEMWQYIFTYLPPYSLGRLMCVNKTFQTLLAPDGLLPAPQLAAHRPLSPVDQEHLWSLSRRAFFPGMPRPLFSRSELETWKLIRGNGCQFCGKQNTSSVPSFSTSPWAAGPGNDHVRVIWAFAVRSCGSCLRTRLHKETDLLFSASSALLPALPFAFFTPSLNYVASITVRSESPPMGLQLTKWYFGPQVDEMKTKLDDVRELGAATAEEWFKGLEFDGREKAADTARWEHWESAGGFQAIAHTIFHTRHCQPPNRELQHFCSTSSEKQSSSCLGRATADPSPVGRLTTDAQAQLWSMQAPPSTLPVKPATPISPYGLAFPGIGQHFSMSATKPHVRVERSIHDVNEKKNARRVEIERRCAELNPPIKPSALALMDSFVAALQIAMPLTDQAWELLKPRLLAQREAAEQQEREQLAQNQFLIQRTEERKQQEAQLKEAKENLDRVWEDSQKSVRGKLETYADNFIRDQWQDGVGITKDSCTQFAADMLLHVRHRFCASIAQEDAQMRAMGAPIPTHASQAALTRKLTLENMRWVYENKIRPLTEHFQKELFLCNACDNHGRYYSLDSVVQHFAAKHTDSLSMGTAVVYWKADWPELPPFDPNPTAAKASMYMAANLSPALAPDQFMYNAPSTHHGRLTGTHMPVEQPTYPTHHAHYASARLPQGYGISSPAYQEPPSPRNAFHRMDQTASRIHNHSPTTNYPPAQGYGHPQPTDHHDWRRQQGLNNAINLYQQQLAGSLPSPQPELGTRPRSALSYIAPNPIYPSISPASNHFSRPQAQACARPLFNPVPPGQPMGIYQVQIQDLAKNAREIWNGTSDILDMPDSVRVQVIIRHVVLRFKDKYTNEPNLALFTDGLNNNSQMSPMRALSDLVCKACKTATYGNSDHQNLEHRKHTLPALLAHFQSVHVEHVPAIPISRSGVEFPRLDWKFDMVEIPDATVVRNLMYSPGITQAKLSLIATVLPSCFPSPLPQVDHTPYHDNSGVKVVGSGPGKTAQDYGLPRKDVCGTRAPFNGSHSTIGHFQHGPVAEGGQPLGSAYRFEDDPNQGASRSDGAARENEYDPHHPAYVDASNIETRSLGTSDFQDHGRSHGHQEISTYGVASDQRPPQDIEADVSRYRTATTPEHGAHQNNQGPPGRADLTEQEFPITNTSISESQSRWGVPESRSAQNEIEATPGHESPNAAEQFLQSFDLTSATFQEPVHPAPPVGTSRREEYSHHVVKNSGFGPRTDDHSWLPDRLNVKSMEHGARTSSIDVFSAQGRIETSADAISESHQARENDRLYAARLAETHTKTYRSQATSPDSQALSKAKPGHFPPHLKTARDSPSRRPKSRFERYEAQRQGSQRAHTRSPATAIEATPADEAFPPGSYSMDRTAGRQIHAAQAEERYRSYPYAEEITYRRAPQSSQQIRYIEKPRYLEPIHDRYVEYVRVAPRDSEVSEEYYIQRPAAHDGSDGYVGYGPTRPREQLLEQEGHVYARAPPSSEEYRDTYTRQMAYQ